MILQNHDDVAKEVNTRSEDIRKIDNGKEGGDDDPRPAEEELGPANDNVDDDGHDDAGSDGRGSFEG